MTTDDLARLRTLAEAATPGPWSAVPYTRSDSVWRITEASPPNMGIARVYDRSWSRDAVGFGDENAAYIAALDPQTVLNLLDAAALSDAWKRVEAALPEGGRAHLQRRAEAEATVLEDGKTWVARQGRAVGAYEAWATDPAKALGFAYADTPVLALLALAERLEARP